MSSKLILYRLATYRPAKNSMFMINRFLVTVGILFIVSILLLNLWAKLYNFEHNQTKKAINHHLFLLNDAFF